MSDLSTFNRNGPDPQDLVDDADYAASQTITSTMIDETSKSRKDEAETMDDQEVLFVKDNVAVHPTQNVLQRINGRLRVLKDGSSVFMTWIPYARRSNNDSGMNDRLLYTIQGMSLSKIRSIRRHSPPLGWQYVIIVLTSGLAFPPLYFHNGGIKEFLVTLKEHVHIVRSADDANLFLVNDISQDPLQRSLTSLELRDVVSTAAVPSQIHNVSAEPLSIQPNLSQTLPQITDAEPVNRLNGDNVHIADSSQQQQRRKSRDPTRDISIHVLEKFSLVTKFARDTTAQLFGESRLLGSTDPLDGLDSFYGVKKQPERQSVLREPASSLSAGESRNSPEPAILNSIGSSEIDTTCTGLRLPPLGEEEWLTYFDHEGRIPNSKQLRERIFYGGIEHNLRCQIWKFLLGFHLYDSTYKEREELSNSKHKEYLVLKAQWQTISNDQAKRFTKFRERKSRIEKDVVRTDRTIPFYADDDNPNVTKLRDILITYSFYNFDLGYCQGMSDFLSPILYVVEDESESFWCFAALMEHVAPNFHRDQNGMHSQLLALSKLVELLDRPLHSYLKQADCLNYFFCFRWLLIQFKREFEYEDVIRLWEALWTNHLTEHLHLYIAVAILKSHRKKIIEEEMDFDTLLKFINELSGHINLESVLKQSEVLFKIAGDHGAACIPPGTPPSLRVPENVDIY